MARYLLTRAIVLALAMTLGAQVGRRLRDTQPRVGTTEVEHYR